MKILLLLIFTTTIGYSQRWEYSEKVDKMNNQPVYYAECETKEAILVVRNSPSDVTDAIYGNTISRVNEVYLKSKGHVFDIPNEGMTKTVVIKFNENFKKDWYVNYSANGVVDALFFNFKNNLIKQLKSTEKLLIEVRYYTEGRVVLDFNCGKLDWKYK